MDETVNISEAENTETSETLSPEQLEVWKRQTEQLLASGQIHPMFFLNVLENNPGSGDSMQALIAEAIRNMEASVQKEDALNKPMEAYLAEADEQAHSSWNTSELNARIGIYTSAYSAALHTMAEEVVASGKGHEIAKNTITTVTENADGEPEYPCQFSYDYHSPYKGMPKRLVLKEYTQLLTRGEETDVRENSSAPFLHMAFDESGHIASLMVGIFDSMSRHGYAGNEKISELPNTPTLAHYLHPTQVSRVLDGVIGANYGEVDLIMNLGKDTAPPTLELRGFLGDRYESRVDTARFDYDGSHPEKMFRLNAFHMHDYSGKDLPEYYDASADRYKNLVTDTLRLVPIHVAVGDATLG